MVTNKIAAAALTVQLVLPAFSDFAKKAGLDLELPIREERLTKSYVSKHSPAVMVIVDGRHQFNWQSREDKKGAGWINYYDRSNSISRLEGEKQLLPLAKQESLITTNDAREIAYRFLERAGYDLAKVKAGPPTVKQWAYQAEGEPPLPMPGYNIQFTPKGMAKPHWSETLLEIEVSGLTKRITRFTSSPLAADALEVDLEKLQRRKSEY